MKKSMGFVLGEIPMEDPYFFIKNSHGSFLAFLIIGE
jgi:hypothetical protein